ncbi:MAG: PKD domain-containing protein, partial [Gammaproteobacteria bacterium]
MTRKILSAVACTCAALAFGVAHAGGGGGGATCSIDTVPSPPVITAGGSVDFLGNINGGQKTFSWTFPGGNPLNSTAQDVTVTYPNSGTFTASLSGTSSKGTCPTVTVDVIVEPVGNCVRNAPTISLGADEFIAPDGSAVYTVSVTNNDT